MNQLAIDVDSVLRDVGRELAEEGMARTLASESEAWISSALDALKRFSAQPEWREFTVESFRAWYLASGYPGPNSHKCWGAFTSKASKAGVIVWTGKYANSVSPKTHGHPVKVWRAA